MRQYLHSLCEEVRDMHIVQGRMFQVDSGAGQLHPQSSPPSLPAPRKHLRQSDNAG